MIGNKAVGLDKVNAELQRCMYDWKVNQTIQNIKETDDFHLEEFFGRRMMKLNDGEMEERSAVSI